MRVKIPTLIRWALIVLPLAALYSQVTVADNAYSITAGQLPFHFVQSNSTEITVTAPSASLLARAVLKLNGNDVTKSLASDGNGSLQGMISGFVGGNNLLQLFANKHAKKASTQLTLTGAMAPRIDCVSMKGRSLAATDIALPTKGATITDAKLVPAAVAAEAKWSLPEYCAISGTIASLDASAPNIHFQLDIPTAWGEKAFQEGGGGTNGFIPQQVTNPTRSPLATSVPEAPPVLAEGYAIYGSDSGHQSRLGRGGPGGPPARGGVAPPPAAGGAPVAAPPANAAADNAWVVNQESWMNFSYEQIKKTHDAAIAVMLAMYGKKPTVTYFIGTSQGGREGLEALSRYPEDYDGVLSQVPLAYFAGLLFDPSVKGVSQLTPGTWVPPAKAPTIAAEIVRLCDSLDGLEDGIISNYVACDKKLDPAFTPNPLANIRCAGGEDTGNNCLSDKQIETVNSFHTTEHFGYSMVNGESDWPGWGTGMEGVPGPFGWLLSATQPDVNNPQAFNGGLGAAVQKGRLGGNQDFNLLTLNFPGFQKQIQVLSDQLDVREDWSRFFARKGKLIWVTGGSDYISNPRAQMRLYDRVAAHSGQATVDQFVRYYVSPNVGHGLNGSSATGASVPLPNLENTLFYLQDWVENGNPPPDPVIQQTAATQTPSATRPLCRYPKYPRYNGSGDTKLASSYTCTVP
jgi:hypothetical protein